MNYKLLIALVSVATLLVFSVSAYSQRIFMSSENNALPAVIVSKVYDSYLMFWNNQNNATKVMGSVYQPQVTCSSYYESRLQYNFTSHKYMFCNSTNWVSFP